VSAPAVVTVPEGGAAVIVVHAMDPDGEPITLTADVASLPAGYRFKVAPGDTTAELVWVPTYLDAGEHVVTFHASNALTGSATTKIVVTNVDIAPTVTAPDSVAVAEASPLTIHVKVADPDGDPVDSFTADLRDLPFGNNADFTLDPGGKSATLTWTPDLGSSVQGSRPARLAAAALSARSRSSRLIVPSCASSRATSVSDGAPAAGRGTSGAVIGSDRVEREHEIASGLHPLGAILFQASFDQPCQRGGRVGQRRKIARLVTKRRV